MLEGLLEGTSGLFTAGLGSVVGTSVTALLAYQAYKSILLKVNPEKYLNIVTTVIEYGLEKLDEVIDKVKAQKETKEVGEDLQKILLTWIDSLVARLQILRKKLED